ncbi:vicilin Cor a 11.0101-like [Silene latifolia]|uniref:vicilin Cor a 11.0101-like n=1 Tax=Silene latifolia TaxID=37657 RepID=UPI003D76CAF8
MGFFKCIICIVILAFSGVECEMRHENGNPYVFNDEDFTTLFKTEEGKVKVLEKFTERSELFRGIENIRMLFFEANPQTFFIPSHWDSDILFFVAQGRGTISLVFEDRRESFNIQKGHLMTIPSGITFYMINSDENETLVLASFVKPIANPGHFAPFFGVGGQDPESFYYAFSPEVLETAFNASIDRLQTAFSQQGKGVIIRATKDQIKALTAEEDSQLPFGNSYCLKKFGPCQIFSHLRDSTEFGKLYMVDPSEYVKLQELDMYISFSITSQGCMSTPFHSTRVVKIIMVVNGQGRFEMAAPYEEEGSTRIRYKKISSELRRGMVFVIPPGHPTVIMASQDKSLETLNLEFFAKGNERFLLAGRGNIMKNFQKEAKELAFATSAEKVDEILDSQQLDFFMRGPTRFNPQDTATF